MIIAAQNPCPCGYFGDNSHACTCNPASIIRYQKKISGPLLDRIDIHISVPKVETSTLTTHIISESSKEIRLRVQKARDRQLVRFTGTSLSSNADMSSRDIKIFCSLSSECLDILKKATDLFGLSARSYYRIIKLSRTIADLEESEHILPTHVAEALQYRPKQHTL
jgi:magnesium chelatase family protein